MMEGTYGLSMQFCEKYRIRLLFYCNVEILLQVRLCPNSAESHFEKRLFSNSQKVITDPMILINVVSRRSNN